MNLSNNRSTPLVSIVTPSFNQSEYIRETIQSVLGQDYPNLEYWVVDGGSTDGTLEILAEFDKDPRIFWRSEPDQGQADAINKGWNCSKGTILGWLNSDDLYLPGAVTAAVTSMQRHPIAAFVYSNYQLIDEFGQHLDTKIVRQANFVDQLLFRCLIPQQTVFVRRSVIEELGGPELSLHYALDQELWTRVLEQYQGKYVNDIWAQQRVHSSAKTHAQWARLYEEFHRVVARYQDHQGIFSQDWEEACRRSSLNMFIASAAQNNLLTALEHLSNALSDGCFPFNSPGYSVKHVVYIIRHWHSHKQSTEIFDTLAQVSPPESPQAGFLTVLRAYNAYQNERYLDARRLAKQAMRLDANLRRDRYLTLLPYLCLGGPYRSGLHQIFGKPSKKAK